jgi:hypothetical protein
MEHLLGANKWRIKELLMHADAMVPVPSFNLRESLKFFADHHPNHLFLEQYEVFYSFQTKSIA